MVRERGVAKNSVRDGAELADGLSDSVGDGDLRLANVGVGISHLKVVVAEGEGCLGLQFGHKFWSRSRSRTNKY